MLVAGLLAGCWPGGDDDAPSSKADSLPAVAWTAATADEVRQGGTLRLAFDAWPADFNPAHAPNADSGVGRVLSPTHGSAIRVSDDGGWEVDPLYATSVEIVDRDPFTVEVRLNPDAVWQDGSPITAADMEAYVAARNGSDDAYEVSSTAGYDRIDDVRAGDDEFSYSVTFSEPVADWPRYVYPELPRSVTAEAKTFNTGFVRRAVPSNGPFVVSSIEADTGRVEMVPNPRWWGPSPRLNAIIWQAAAPDLQVKAIANGELDVVDVPATQPLGDVGDAAVQIAAGTEWAQLTFNGAEGPLRDVKVRRAIALALDRTEIAALASRGAAPSVPGSFVFVPGQRGYTSQSGRITHSVADAKKVLDGAGWKLPSSGAVREKDGTPLSLVMPVPKGTATSRARAELIADQLARVGIRVELQSVAAESFFADRVQPLDFDLVTFSYQNRPFAVAQREALFHPIDSAQNVTGLEDEDLHDAWIAADRALDDQALTAAVAKLDRRLFAVIPMVPLGVHPDVAVVRDGVVNIGAAQFAEPDWTIVGFRS